MIPLEVAHRVRRLLELAARGEPGERALADAEVSRVLARHGAAMRRLSDDEARFTAALIYEAHDVVVVPINPGEQVEVVLLGEPAALSDAVAAHRALVEWMQATWGQELRRNSEPPRSGGIILFSPPRLDEPHRRSFYLGLGQRLYERLVARRRQEGLPPKPPPMEEERAESARQEEPPQAAAPEPEAPPPSPPLDPWAPHRPRDPEVERGHRTAVADARAKRHAAVVGYAVGATLTMGWAQPLQRLPLALPAHEGA